MVKSSTTNGQNMWLKLYLYATPDTSHAKFKRLVIPRSLICSSFSREMWNLHLPSFGRTPTLPKRFPFPSPFPFLWFGLISAFFHSKTIWVSFKISSFDYPNLEMQAAIVPTASSAFPPFPGFRSFSQRCRFYLPTRKMRSSSFGARKIVCACSSPPRKWGDDLSSIEINVCCLRTHSNIHSSGFCSPFD